jgi:AraC-like DNA-binding protein/mannose-6-phosphate isomerase-like protein (cupin superfamily)
MSEVSDDITELPPKRIAPVEENLDDSGIWAFESQHGDAFQMDFTRHRFLKLLLITAGAGVIEGDWGEPICKKGDLVVVPAGLRHKIVDSHRQPISLYGLGIAQKLFRPVDRVIQLIPTGVLQAQQLGPLRLENRMRRLLYTHRQHDPLHQLASIAAALDLVVQVSLAVTAPGLFSAAITEAEVEELPSPVDQTDESKTDVAKDTPDPMIETYLMWLQHNFFEPQSLAVAARACGMSRRGFTTAFRIHTGRTWLDHVNRLRVQHAIMLLQTTDRKMASIAFQSGFEDLSTFYRVMHRITGHRPSVYRET